MFTIRDILISSIDYKNICAKPRKCSSHIPLPGMMRPRARNGNVTRNRGGNRLERKTHVRTLNYRASFSSEMHMKLAYIKIRA